MTEQNPQHVPNDRSRRRLAGIGILAFLGAALILLMLAPVIFRGFDEEMQFRLIRRFPFMAAWQIRATPPFESLPTIASTDDDAAALLLITPEPPTSTPSTTSTVIPLTETPTTVIASSTPVPPTEVPATATGTETASPTATTTVSATVGATVSATASATALKPSATPLILQTTAVPPTFTETQVPPTATFTITATATVPPTATIPPTSTHRPTLVLSPTETPTEPPTVSPTTISIPVSYHASGYKWIPQTWNNCGPANLAQALEPFGWQGDQASAAAYLKPNREDKNVNPAEIVKYVNDKTGVRAITRVAGDLDLIRRLVSQQFSVIIETGFVLPEEGWMGHYLTVIGYDNGKGIVYGLDTFLGDGPNNLGMEEKINDLDARWQHFNRTYIVLYSPERENELNQILGADADPAANAQHALAVARDEAKAKSDNPYAWFNLGSSFVLTGQYGEAATAYDRAFRVGKGLPWRMLWYQFGPYAAYYHTGRYATLVTLINASMQTTTYVEETYYWRGMAEAAADKTALAVQDFKHALAFNPNFTLAAEALASIENGTFVSPATPTPPAA